MTDAEKIEIVRNLTWSALRRYRQPLFLEMHKTNEKKFAKDLRRILKALLQREPTEDEIKRADGGSTA